MKPKDKVIPVRMSDDDLRTVDSMAREAGLPRTEIMRRAFRFLKRESQRRGGLGFIIDEANE